MGNRRGKSGRVGCTWWELAPGSLEGEKKNSPGESPPRRRQPAVRSRPALQGGSHSSAQTSGLCEHRYTLSTGGGSAGPLTGRCCCGQGRRIRPETAAFEGVHRNGRPATARAQRETGEPAGEATEKGDRVPAGLGVAERGGLLCHSGEKHECGRHHVRGRGLGPPGDCPPGFGEDRDRARVCTRAPCLRVRGSPGASSNRSPPGLGGLSCVNLAFPWKTEREVGGRPPRRGLWGNYARLDTARSQYAAERPRAAWTRPAVAESALSVMAVRPLGSEFPPHGHGSPPGRLSSACLHAHRHTRTHAHRYAHTHTHGAARYACMRNPTDATPRCVRSPLL